MFTDPIKLSGTIASILPANGTYYEETFRLVNPGDSESRRVAQRADASIHSSVGMDLSIRNVQTNENKGAGLRTIRTSVGLFITAPKGLDAEGVVTDPTEIKGSVNIVFSLPQGVTTLTPAHAFNALCKLAFFCLTASDDQTANTAVTVENTRLLRLLAGEA
jgi:hypothetical protein